MSALQWLISRPVAHRGLHDAASGVIENTPSAFAAAIAAGYAIECDLQLSGDGEAMVHHDDGLGRLTDGTARLDAMTAIELKAVPFTGTADRMLRIGELLDLVAGQVPLLIEVKSRFDGDERLAARAAAVLSTYAGPAALMSFDPAPIALLRRIAPGVVRGLVAERAHGRAGIGRAASYIRHVCAARPQFIAYSIRDLPAPVPLAARTLLGVPLLTWTVRSEQDCQRAARWADQIIFEGFRPPCGPAPGGNPRLAS
jgi:glycerophosphoryl diester phosphodiesterase